MIVFNYEIIPHTEGTYFLKLNGDIVANYFYDLNSEFDSLIQVDVCSHCFYPGCSDHGFIEVVDFDPFIVWKEPLNSKYSSSNREFNPIECVSVGTIVWPKSKYNEFVSEITHLNRSTSNSFGLRAKAIDLFDVWRIEGSQVYSPGGFKKYEVEEIYQNRIGLYSMDLSEHDCEIVFYEAANIFDNKMSEIEIIEVNDEMKPIIMIFDRPEYKEWKCLYLLNQEVLYSFSKGLVARIS